MADARDTPGFTGAQTERFVPLGGRLRILDAARRVSTTTGGPVAAAAAPRPQEARPPAGKAAEAERLERLLNSILRLFAQGRLCLRPREDAHAVAAGQELQAAAARLRRGRNGGGAPERGHEHVHEHEIEDERMDWAARPPGGTDG